MLYPDTLQNYHRDVSGFTIRDEFADQIDVTVTAWQLPVINRHLMDGDSGKGKRPRGRGVQRPDDDRAAQRASAAAATGARPAADYE